MLYNDDPEEMLKVINVLELSPFSYALKLNLPVQFTIVKIGSQNCFEISWFFLLKYNAVLGNHNFYGAIMFYSSAPSVNY